MTVSLEKVKNAGGLGTGGLVYDEACLGMGLGVVNGTGT